MKTSFKAALVVALMLGVALPAEAAPARRAAPTGAAAPASGGAIVPGVAIAALDVIVANTDAVRAANQQRPTTYKLNYDAVEKRRAEIAAQLKPMYDKLEADSKVPGANQTTLQASATTVRAYEQNAEQELNTIAQPIALSQAYVTEQVEAKLDQAVRNAMSARGVTLLLNPTAIVALNNNAYNLNPGILAELNKLVPTAQLVPPTDWVPRQVREARAQQAAAAQQGAAPAVAPAASPAPAVVPAAPASNPPKPSGR
jgi:Skp family chaperone for outer membrane proteins